MTFTHPPCALDDGELDRILGEDVELLVDINANYTLDFARYRRGATAPLRIRR